MSSTLDFNNVISVKFNHDDSCIASLLEIKDDLFAIAILKSVDGSLGKIVYDSSTTNNWSFDSESMLWDTTNTLYLSGRLNSKWSVLGLHPF